MAIPKKRRRKIVVDDTPYYWLVRGRATTNQKSASAFMGNEPQGRQKCIVVRADLEGSILRIILPNWQNAMYGADDYEFRENIVQITPKYIAQAIGKAIEAGWCAESKGRVFELDLSAIVSG